MYLLNRVPSKVVPKTPLELWINRTPSIRHLHVWGFCQAEIRIYNPQKRKLDASTISGYFIGYSEKSKGYMFYCPNHSMRIVDTGNTRLIENGEISGSTIPRDVKIKEVRVQVPLAYASNSKMIAPLVVVPNNNEEEQHNNELMIHNEPIVDEPHKVTLRRSQRERRQTILNDYVVYLYETKTNLSINDNDLVSFSQVVSYDNYEKWLNAMKEEINSMEHNGVWDFVELSKGCERISCKWVFKTKRNFHGNLERYNVRLVAKGFTQKDDIDYKETFSLVS